MKRKQLSKNERIKVLNKYDKHCAYCGKEIAYKDMQVDHKRPFREWTDALVEGINLNDMENLMPSCRSCNHYKRTLDLEGFREYIKTLHERIAKDYIVKIGINFGIVKLEPFDGIFYFEKLEEEKNELSSINGKVN